MAVIAAILVALTALSFASILLAKMKRTQDLHEPGPKQMEPDLELVSKPHLIGKIPENEKKIPDSNAA